MVLQYHQDITDHDGHAALALGGSNIAAQNGQTYDSWVSDLARRDRLGPLQATQLDGSVRTYDGTYTVANGVVASAHITKTSYPNPNLTEGTRTMSTTDTTPDEVAPAPCKPWHDRKVILAAALSVVLAAAIALTVLLGA